MTSSVQPPETGPNSPSAWKAGDRVLAGFPASPNGWYPGTVRSVEGEQVTVDFDDGDSACVGSDHVAALEIPAGSKVLGRWLGGPRFYPGRVELVDGQRFHVRYDDGDEEWTTAKFLCVPVGGPARIKQEKATVHQTTDRSSPVVGELSAGQEVQLGRYVGVPGDMWVEVRFPGGRRGYLPGDTAIFQIHSLILRQEEAPVRAAPAAAADVVATLKKGERFTALDRLDADGRPWLKVRHGAGAEGYLDANTYARRADEPEPTWWGSVGTGAWVILSMTGLALLGLVVNGEYTTAAVVLAVCAVSGGLAGLVHHGTEPLRRHEFGYHVAWTLVWVTYLGVAVLLAIGFGMLFLDSGVEVPGSEMPVWFVLVFLLGFGVLFGLLSGYMHRWEQFKADGRFPPLTSWVIPAVGGLGALAVLVGGAFLWVAGDGWRLAHEADQTPQEITLADLVTNGYGANRHVHLTGFRFCDKKATEGEREGDGYRVVYLWAPVVSAAGPEETGDVPVPNKILAVVRESEMQYDVPPHLRSRWEAVLMRNRWRNKEEEGYTGVVVNGLQRLPRQATDELHELAPETDLESVLMISADVKPVAVGDVMQRLLIGSVVAGLGLLVLGLAFAWGRSVRRSGPVAAV